MGSLFPPAVSALSLPVCLLAPPSMPSVGNCFPCVTVNLGKYVLYSSALSWQARWRTSLAMSFGGAGVSSFLMENIVNNDNACDFRPKEKKTQTQHYIYACRDTEDGCWRLSLCINRCGIVYTSITFKSTKMINSRGRFDNDSASHTNNI
jgi:hypothetical protein